MSINLILREDKGTALTYAELDSNFKELKEEFDVIASPLSTGQVGGVLAKNIKQSVPSVAALRTIAGRYDGDSVDLVSYTAGSNKGSGTLTWRASSVAADDGVRWFAVSGVSTGRWEFISGQILSNMTIKIPSDYATFQLAIDSLHGQISTCEGVLIDLVCEATHQPSTGITVLDGDYGYFRVSTLGSSLTLVTGFVGRFINALNANAPILNCYVIGNTTTCDRIYSVQNGRGVVNPACGGEKTSGRILYGNVASITAANTIWKQSGDSAYFSAGSSAQMGGSLIEAFTVTANGALVASRGSVVEAQSITIKDCSFAVECKRSGSAVNMHEGSIINPTNIGIRCSRGGTASLDEGSITGNIGTAVDCIGGNISISEGVEILYSNVTTGTNAAIKASATGRVSANNITIVGANYGVLSSEAANISIAGSNITGSILAGISASQLSVVDARSSTITGSGNKDVLVSRGAVVDLHNATTTNSTIASTPNITDTNIFSFNQMELNGTIYSQTTQSPSAIMFKGGDSLNGWYRRGDGWQECWSTISYDTSSTSVQNFQMPITSAYTLGQVSAGFTSTESSIIRTEILSDTMLSITSGTRWSVRKKSTASSDGVITLRLWASGYIA